MWPSRRSRARTCRAPPLVPPSIDGRAACLSVPALLELASAEKITFPLSVVVPTKLRVIQSKFEALQAGIVEVLGLTMKPNTWFGDRFAHQGQDVFHPP